MFIALFYNIPCFQYKWVSFMHIINVAVINDLFIWFISEQYSVLFYDLTPQLCDFNGS